MRIHADIPFGNVADAAVRREGERTIVEFTAHPHGGAEALWFCFRIERDAGDPEATPITLVLKHVGTLLAGLTPGTCGMIRPVVRHDGGDWRRLDPGVARSLPDGRQWASWEIEGPRGWVEVAFCYPYGQDDLRRLLDQTRDAWRTDTIGVSQAGRPLLRLSTGPGAPDDPTPGVYLLARQHAGETPGSWVLDGLLHRAAQQRPGEPLIWCVPLADPDGIERGDYGKDQFPHDLARAWGRWAMRHEVQIIQRDMRLWASRCRPALAIDFHAPGPGEGDGVYAFTRWGAEDAPEFPGVRAWAERFAAALGDDASPRFARAATHGGRWNDQPSFTRFVGPELNTPALILEIPYSQARGRALERMDYQAMGHRLADAIAAHLASQVLQ